jgi:Bifunctional DNA primase/polymerase, N-terminal
VTTLTIARRLLVMGLSVIPVPRADGRSFDGKIPAIAWRVFQGRLPTDDELILWIGSGAAMNLAIVTGAVSGVVVIDLDSPEALRYFTRRFPYTPWQTKTSKGWHLFYRHPGVLVRNRARIETGAGKLGIDVRGDGGFVIAPGSVHASGATYEFAGDWSQPREALPRFWPGWLARPARPAAPPTATRPTGNVVTRARAYLAAIPPPEIGCGSDGATLYAACRLVRGFGLSSGDAESLLWEWAGSRPGWTREWMAQKVVHAERYGTESIGALR